MCRVGTAATRRHNNTVAHQLSRRHGCGMLVADGTVGWFGKWQGGMVAMWHGLLIT